MKSKTLCLPCTVRTAQDTAKRATDDEELQEKVVFESMKWLLKNPNYSDLPPSILHTKVYQITKEITGNPDPFSSDKKTTNIRAKEIAPQIKRRLEEKKSFQESFRLAVKSSICGNSIDFEVEEHEFSPQDMKNVLLNCLEDELAIDDINHLMKLLEESEEILYLMDNSGEIVFDKILIEKIKENYNGEIRAVVKEDPILNDATMEDAKHIHLQDLVSVITTGNGYIGVYPDNASTEFLNHLNSADIIVAKGQGCYESLTEMNLYNRICYILRAKCIQVAKDLGVEKGEGIVKIV